MDEWRDENLISSGWFWLYIVIMLHIFVPVVAFALLIVYTFKIWKFRWIIQLSSFSGNMWPFGFFLLFVLINFYWTVVAFVGFPSGSAIKNLPVMQEIEVWSLSQEDPLEKEMVTHSSILAWRLPWSLVKRSLVGYSPRDCKKLDMTEWLTHIAAEEGPSDSLDLRGHMPLCSLPLFIFLNIKFFL